MQKIRNRHLDRLIKEVTAPESDEAFQQWVEFSDLPKVLDADTRQDEIILYASLNGVFLNAVAVPAGDLDHPNPDDLLSWSFNACHHWNIDTRKGKLALFPPLTENTGSVCLDAAEQLVFLRSYDGIPDKKQYLEISQPFLHSFGLHWDEARSAYCCIDEHGDIDECVRWVVFTEKEHGSDARFATCQRELIEIYLHATETSLARTFDIWRTSADFDYNWRGNHTDGLHTVDGRLFYRRFFEPRRAGHVRGVQVIQPRLSAADCERRLFGSSDPDQFASFIALDPENNRTVEISCNPSQTRNIFQKSDQPSEMSTAFFRGEVLSKYKADPEKYELTDRHLSCRGGWFLRSYDINEENQVHTYLAYLRELPYSEQLHWKSCNEAPRAGLSRRAITTDFEAEFYEEYDALTSLREQLIQLDRAKVDWWTLRQPELLNRLHYPITGSAEEWARELHSLHKLLVEGFEEKELRNTATKLGRPAAKLRSIKLIEACLSGLGYDEELAREMTAPLHELHTLRSEVIAHSTGTDAAGKKKQLLKEHGSYMDHFKQLCRRCDEAFRSIAETLSNLDPSASNRR